MKTKTYIFVITVLVASLLLAGCHGQAITTVAASSGLSAATILAAGTLKLQDTSNAITSSQASELLTFWEAYQSMSNSDTTSQLELDALEQQIESSMTSGQLQVIDEIGLEEQSVSELLQSTVSSPGSSSNSTASSLSASSTMGSSSSSQGGGPSGMPTGGQGGPGGDSLTSTINGDVPSTQSTPAATQSVSNTASAQVSPMLVQAVIQMLKSLSQGAASSSQASG